MSGVAATLRDDAPAAVPVCIGASDRDHLLERLHNLRTILPVMATELARARRQAAQLRVENRRLKEQLRRAQDGASGARTSATVHRRLNAKLARDGRTGMPSRPWAHAQEANERALATRCPASLPPRASGFD